MAPEIRVSARARVPLRPAGVAALAAAVIRAERGAVVALSISFVGATRMRALNRAHLGRHGDTDVIAFALGATPMVAGDIYICPAVAARHAAETRTTLRHELRRLVVHGVLHVLGYEHDDGSARMHGPMWRRQERYVARFGALAR